MTDTIAALQNEIEAAEDERVRLFVKLWRMAALPSVDDLMKHAGYGEYIRGLQTAVRLLEQDEARELPY